MKRIRGRRLDVNQGQAVELGGEVSITDVEAIARRRVRVALSEAARKRVSDSHWRLRELECAGRSIYGLTTGVGALEVERSQQVAEPERQKALLRSHASGVGSAMPEDEVRAMLVARAAVLARGMSGVTPETLDALVALINSDVVPVVPRHGSVGASDLAPLAAAALVLIGEGRARVGGRAMSATRALARVGLAPIELFGRDALALINGPAQSAGIAALAVCDARTMLVAGELTAIMTLYASGAPRDFLDSRLAELKRHPGQLRSAELARGLCPPLLVAPEAAHVSLMRTPLSSRYGPQVHGALRTALGYAWDAAQNELSAISDNPLICDDGFVTSNSATTCAQELAMALDQLVRAITAVAVASERRTASLLDGRGALPMFLRHAHARPGVDSGLMIAQYTAASLVAELRARTGSAAIQSIPTCAGTEDYVPMTALAARQAAFAVERAREVIAIELLCAVQALDVAGVHVTGPLADVYANVRARVPMWIEDRLLADDLARVIELVRGGLGPGVWAD